MNDCTQERTRPVVLVVDDDARARIILREALEQEDFIVEEADDGGPGLECFKTLQPDLILLDVVMPTMDGFETCREIRKLPGGEHTPIVLMTGLDDTESINLAFDIGATSFVTKPLNYLLLTYRLKYLLRSKQTADALRNSEARLEKSQLLARLGHWEWDLSKRLIRCSETLQEIVGLSKEDSNLRLRGFLNLVDPRDRAQVWNTISRSLRDKDGYNLDHRIVGPDGSDRVIYQEAEVCRNASGRIEKVIGIAQDITERRRSEEKIRYLAYFDTVTNLPNRALLKQIFAHTMANAKRYERTFALMFLDLDHFKRINDTLGHNAGDELLREVANRLRSCLRSCDRMSEADREVDPVTAGVFGGDAVTRLGGDEFVILLTEIRNPESAAVVARRLSEKLSEPMTVGGRSITLTSSIGISVYPLDAQDFEVMLKKADTAMYHAKETGRNCFKFFTDSLNEDAVRRFNLENELRQAIDKNQFTLFYQPKININTNRIVGVEALIRWNHPTRGLIGPNDFIPFAEEIGLIIPIGDWVLNEALAQAVKWQKAGRTDLKISINLSPPQFTQTTIVDNISSLLNSYNLNPFSIELEITEGLLLEGKKSNVEKLTALREMGVNLALDDFGVGYSSLSYLKDLPLNSLKIDRSFVSGLNEDKQNNAIVQAIITLAHSLDLVAVAEGVETEDQLEFLRSHICDEVQGFFFSHPLPIDEIEEWIAKYNASAQDQEQSPEKAIAAIGG